MQQILDKYKFTHTKDKENFIEILEKIEHKLKREDKEAFYEIVDFCLEKNTEFDTRITYNPIELLDAIFEKDLLWEKIDTDEIKNIIEKISFFEKYYKWEISKKDFLEKKYGAKIIFLKEDLQILSAEIYGFKLSKMQQILALKEIEKTINFYPFNFIKNINLASIVVSAYFYKKSGFGTTILWGFETHSDNNIYLALRDIEITFHHELYHQAMDYYDDLWNWKNLRNEQDLKYLYKDIYKNSYWFARNYGKENVAEDQATIAEEIITNYHSLYKRIQKDKILRKKVELVLKAYESLSEWKMNKDFWKERFGFYVLD